MSLRSSFARLTERRAAGLLAAVVCLLAVPLPAGAANEKPPGDILLYTDPARGYSLPIPPGAEMPPRTAPGPVRINSRKGYVVTVQVADASSTASLADLQSRFEAENLGEGKRWHNKIAGRSATIAGLPGVDASYVSPNAQARVVIVRGARTDHVLMFMVTPDHYQELVGEFEWILAHFEPGPGEGGKKAGIHAPAAAMAAGPVRLDRRFADKALGFIVAYPGDWVAERESPHLVVFSGARGTDAFRVTVGIENVRPPAIGDSASAFAAVLTDFKSRLLRAVPDLRFEAETPLFRGEGETRIEGIQFLVGYNHGGEAFRKWVVVMRHAGRPVAHIWSYTAPADRFDTFRPVAEAMLESWIIEDGR